MGDAETPAPAAAGEENGASLDDAGASPEEEEEDIDALLSALATDNNGANDITDSLLNNVDELLVEAVGAEDNPDQQNPEDLLESLLGDMGAKPSRKFTANEDELGTVDDTMSLLLAEL